MGTVTPAELLRLYTLEKITIEMSIGHILQNLVILHKALESVAQLERDVERLVAFTGMDAEGGK